MNNDNLVLASQHYSMKEYGVSGGKASLILDLSIISTGDEWSASCSECLIATDRISG